LTSNRFDSSKDKSKSAMNINQKDSSVELFELEQKLANYRHYSPTRGRHHRQRMPSPPSPFTNKKITLDEDHLKCSSSSLSTSPASSSSSSGVQPQQQNSFSNTINEVDSPLTRAIECKRNGDQVKKPTSECNDSNFILKSKFTIAESLDKSNFDNESRRGTLMMACNQVKLNAILHKEEIHVDDRVFNPSCPTNNNQVTSAPLATRAAPTRTLNKSRRKGLQE
jgi:hypothetical protein